MCGICGLEKAKPEELDKMNGLLAHRGPDGEGEFMDVNFGFGHKRLAIIDLNKRADQPMVSQDKKHVVVFNGEIYNFQELKKHLQTHEFKSTSDTEVLLAGYKKWGRRVVEKLNGIFAFAIYDIGNGKIFCARDRFGVKPFYYIKHPRFGFSSEIKALLPFVRTEINLDSFSEFMCSEHTFSEKTLFNNIFELKPGFCLEYSLKTHGFVKYKYWSLRPFEIDKNKSKKQWEKEVLRVTKNSVESQLISDVPVGTYLSGGLDSSIVTSITSQKLPYTTHSFCLVFDEANLNSEKSYMKLLLDKYPNIKQHYVELDSKKYWSSFVNCTWFNDYPLVFPAQVAQYILAKEAKKYVTVVLSGEGGDEVFGGYERHHMPVYSKGGYSGLFSFVIYKFLQVIAIMTKKPSNYFVNQFISPSLSQLMTINYFHVLRRMIIYGHQMRKYVFGQKKRLTSPTGGDYLSEYLEAEISRYLRTLLNKQDKMNMAAAIECRVPLLDHELVKKFIAIPQEYKISPKEGKVIFKNSFESYIPGKILMRKKEGFTIPIENYLEKISWGRKILSDSSLVKDGLMSRWGVKYILRVKDVKAVYMTLAVEIWYRLFIKGEARKRLSTLLCEEL